MKKINKESVKKFSKHSFNFVKVIVATIIVGISAHYATTLFGAPILNGFGMIFQLMFNPTFMSYFIGGLFVLVGLNGLMMLHRGMKKMMADLKKDYPAEPVILTDEELKAHQEIYEG